MRIFSDFKDYYDVGMRYGVDPTCVYNRNLKEFRSRIEGELQTVEKVKEVIGSLGVLEELPLFRYSDRKKFVIILFCGTLRIAFRYYNIDKAEYTYHYSVDSILEHIRLVEGAKAAQAFLEYEKHHKRFYRSKVDFSYENITKIFERFQGMKSEKIVNLMHETSVPIITFEIDEEWRANHLVQYNTSLKSLAFFKVLDPFTTYQELSMFISGVLGGSSPAMIQVSDIVRLEKHGFDKKASFRKVANK